MRFSAHKLFAGVTTLLSLASTTLAADCNSGPFGSSTLVGTKGAGGPYCLTGWERGIVIVGIEVSPFPDGTKRMIGKPELDSNEDLHHAINWGVSDTVTQMQMWFNKDGDGLGKIHIETSNEQKLTVGDRTSGPGITILTHSGILLGAEGRVGDWVDNVSWKFLSSTVGKAEITGLKFKEDLEVWNKKQQQAQNPSILNINATYWFRNKKDMTTSKELSSQIKNTFGLSVGVEVGGGVSVPFFASASAKVTTTASYGYEDMRGESQTETGIYTVQWEQTAIIGPGRAVHCIATVESGTFESEYTSTITIHLAGGQTFKITQPGSFSSTGYATGTSSCNNIDAKDAPEGAVVARRSRVLSA
ncbi:hypothetical protein BJ875DRAFT_540157 [Amylocarpus encephaloides]|uniref:Jacalin-type lectin domain-containing protein n=1 Tax=Amylocarpus encephaloides TaxID=45428 RepID=A0A9P7YPX8_9HELO|nr:hypothetical protein BJ875DRAFT_540157 [Amylocarpus encephaloides]